MPILKIDSHGNIVETSDEFGDKVTRRAEPVYSRDVFVKSAAQIDRDHKHWVNYDWQRAQKKALSQAVQISKDKIRQDLQKDFRSRALQDEAYAMVIKNKQADKQERAIMQGMGSGDFNQLAISGYGLSADGLRGPSTDFEKIVNGRQEQGPTYLSGIPSGLGHPGQLGRARTMGSWLSDVTGINFEASEDQEQKALATATDLLTKEAGKILNPAAQPKPVITAPKFAPPSLQASVAIPGIGAVPKFYVYGVLGLAFVGTAVYFISRRRA